MVHRWRTIWFGLIFATFVTRTDATIYFLNQFGNDFNDGLTITSAWRTVNAVNVRTFQAGDQILFHGGETFTNFTLVLDSSTDLATPNNPILISSYDQGRATIDNGSNAAFLAYNCASLLIRNLNFTGAGTASNTTSGMIFYNDFAGSVKLPLLIIDHVEVSGFGDVGILLTGGNGSSGYSDVYIINSSIHDNLHSGIATIGQSFNAHSNIYVGVCEVYNNFGDPNTTGVHSGSGIVLGNVNHGTIEWCATHDNGKNNLVTWQGPVGLWVYNSSYITIQYNESFHNQTGGNTDGGGFDLDINTTQSVMQYNYSHENDGAGYLLCCDYFNNNNVIRYNISQNDCRKVNYGVFDTYGNVSDNDFHNNTIYLTPALGSPTAVMLMTPAINLRIRNNIFVTTGGVRLIWMDNGQNNVLYQGNDYWTSGASFSVVDYGTNYSSFNFWRTNTGREMLGTNFIGFNVDPKFWLPGGGPTFSNAVLIQTFDAYKLQAVSPLVDKGLNLLALFGQNPGPQDFYQTALPIGNGYEVGACELRWNSILQWDSRPWFEAGAMHFTAVGPLKTNYLDASTNLVNWFVLTNWPNGTLRYLDPVGLDDRRFYRLR